MTENSKYFSVFKELIVVDRELPYDIYINSSTNKERERYVKIYAKGVELNKNYLDEFYRKYGQVYVSEADRKAYLGSLKTFYGLEVEKITTIKEAAVYYLDGLFKHKEVSNEFLEESIVSCKDLIGGVISIIEGKEIGQVQFLISKLSFHDFYTYDHSINVAIYAMSILRQVNPHIPEVEVVSIGIAGLFHDIGKIRVPTHIINVPRKLTKEEMEIVKGHPKWGEDLLSSVRGEAVKLDMDLVRRNVVEHHENYDGSGYPFGKKGGELHLYSKIMAIADFYDAVTTKRGYAEKLSSDEAIGLIAKSAGKKVDPFVYLKFQDNLSRILGQRVYHRELEDDFDPSCPYVELPFKKFSPNILQSNFLSNVTKKKAA